MRKIISLLSLLALVLLSVSPALAYDTAKSLGMAGATVAIADDMSAPYANPAGLAKVKKTTVGMSLGSYSFSWKDGANMTGSDTNILENLGGAMALGPGTLFVGDAVLDTMALDLSDFAGDDSFARTKVFAPTAAYGLQVMPNLLAGASVHYVYRSDFVDIPSGGQMNVNDIGLGLNLGAIYTLGPTLDLGASATLIGQLDVSGTANDGSDELTPKGQYSLPSTFRVGLAARPQTDLTVGFQFDLLSGLAYDPILDTDSGSINRHLYADSVIITRLGAEYLIKVEGGVVPVWAGIALTPENNFETSLDPSDPTFPLVIGDMSLAIFSTTSISLGAGYRSNVFDAGIAMQSTTGQSDTGGDTMTISNSRVIASGTFKM